MEQKRRPPWDLIVIAAILLTAGFLFFNAHRGSENFTASATSPTTVPAVTTTTAGKVGAVPVATTTSTTVASHPKAAGSPFFFTPTTVPNTTTTVINGTPCADGTISSSTGQGSCGHHGGETTTTTEQPATTTTTVPKATTTTSTSTTTTSTSTTTTSTTSTTIPAPLPVLQVLGYDKNLEYTLISKTLDGQQLDQGDLHLTYVCRAKTPGVVYIEVAGAAFIPRTFGETLTCDGISRVVDLIVSRKTSSPYTPPGKHVDTTMSLQFDIPGLVPGQKIPGLTTGPATPGLVTGQAIGTAAIGVDYIGWPGL